MRDVYANSLCNICAVGSTNAFGGLFRTRRPINIQPALLRVYSINRHDGYRVLEQHFIYLDNCWDDQIRSLKLHRRRGWVFQERILPPRILHVAEKQIFWECFEAENAQVSLWAYF